jgi:stage III sporulation protein AB
MFIKLLGSIILIMSAGILGFLGSLKMNARMKELIELQEVCAFIKDEIIVFNHTLPTIFEKMIQKENLGVAHLFKSALLERSQDPYLSLSTAWSHVLRQACVTTSLKKEDLEILEDLPFMIQKADHKGLERNLDYLMGRLRMNEKKALEEKNRNEKLLKVGSVLGGIALSILLF